MKRYYSVRRGRAVGIFTSWERCKEVTQGYPGAEFKGFATRREAELYLGYPEIEHICDTILLLWRASPTVFSVGCTTAILAAWTATICPFSPLPSIAP